MARVRAFNPTHEEITMQNLTLNLETLAVETFEPSNDVQDFFAAAPDTEGLNCSPADTTGCC
jgi:hypothetical protein